MSGVNVEIKENVTKKVKKFITRSGEVKDGGIENLGDDLGGAGGVKTPPSF